MIELALSTCKLIIESTDPISNLGDYDYGEGRYVSYKMNEFIFRDSITNAPLAQIFMSDDTCYKIAYGLECVCDNLGIDNNDACSGKFRMYTVKPVYCWSYDKIGLTTISRDSDGTVSMAFIQSYPIENNGTIFKLILTSQECTTLYNTILEKDRVNFKYF